MTTSDEVKDRIAWGFVYVYLILAVPVLVLVIAWVMGTLGLVR